MGKTIAERRGKIVPSLTGGVLISIVLTLTLLRVLLAWQNPSIHYPDEIFQTVEQAHRLAFGNGIIPWEFREGIRNYLYPGLLAGIMWSAHALEPAPEGYTLAVMSIMALLSILPAWLFARTEFTTHRALLMLLIPGVWFQLAYFGPKTLTEVISTHVLLCGLFLIYPRRQTNTFMAAAAGLLIGIAAGSRFHYLPAAAAIMVWSLTRLPPQKRAVFLGLLGCGIATIGLIDWYFWEFPFQSIVLNLRTNLIEGVASEWGTEPWYFYAGVMFIEWGWAAIPISLLAFLGTRRYPLLAIIAALVIISHSAIGHKEFRFIYLALYVVILLAAAGSAELSGRFGGFAGRWFASIALLFGWSLVSAYEGSNYSRWHSRQPALKAYRALSADTEMCGLGTNIHWPETGGYYALHQDVPIVELETLETDWDNPPFNRMVIALPTGWTGTRESAPDAERFGPFTRQECFGQVCIYSSALVCSAPRQVEYGR